MPRRKNRDQHSGSCRDENVISCRFTDTAEPIVQIVERICGDFDSKARMADSFPTERLVCGYEPAMADLPEDLVTTVVITHNGGGTLVRTMERHRGAAVILVDNGSTDGSADVVARRSRHVRVVRLPFNIGAVARNVGVALARTPDVAFSSGDDSWWAPGALAKAATILQRHQDVAAGAAQIFVGLESRFSLVEVGTSLCVRQASQRRWAT